MAKNIIQLTKDTDDGRQNVYSTIVVTSDGRQLVLYEKIFGSGRETGGRVTKTPPFTVNVASGTGTINGTPVTWGADTLAATPETFQTVYVTDAGVLSIEDALTMTQKQDVIVLAYINTGLTDIVYIEETEVTGKYIYARKQEWNGSAWYWDDYEYLLSTGEQPHAYYDQSADKIYLMYRKDSIVYTRLFDLDDPTSFRYLPNYRIDSGTITMNRDPEQTGNVLSGSSIMSEVTIADDVLFPLGTTGLSFRLVLGVYEPHIYLPALTGSYLDEIIYPYWIQIMDDGFNVEETIEFSDNLSINPGRWHQYTGSLGMKYLRAKVNSNLVHEPYFSPVTDYKEVTVFDPFEDREIVGDTINSNTIDGVGLVASGSAIISSVEKTYEYEESRVFVEDSGDVSSGSAYESKVTTTSEFEENRASEEDSGVVHSGGAYQSRVDIVTP